MIWWADQRHWYAENACPRAVYAIFHLLSLSMYLSLQYSDVRYIATQIGDFIGDIQAGDNNRVNIRINNS